MSIHFEYVSILILNSVKLEFPDIKTIRIPITIFGKSGYLFLIHVRDLPVAKVVAYSYGYTTSGDIIFNILLQRISFGVNRNLTQCQGTHTI